MMFPIFLVKVGPSPSHNFLPPFPHPLPRAHFYALPVRNCPLPDELKLRENTEWWKYEYKESVIDIDFRELTTT